MGCVSSKLISKEIKQEKKLLKNGDNTTTTTYTHHIVSLTSSTYGHLKLDTQNQNQIKIQPQEQDEPEAKHETSSSPSREDPAEIINTWELMEGLEDDSMPPAVISLSKKSPKSSRPFFKNLADIDVKTPLKFLNPIGSPRNVKKFGGKENKGVTKPGSFDNSPKTVLRECNNSSKKPSPRLWASTKRCNSLRIDRHLHSGVVYSRRKNLVPLFDPELVASFEREVSEEEEEIKKMTLESYERKCPPGGEDAVVLYTTTLRGIRKTFEDCNVARSIIESQDVAMYERDVSMDSGFKEELRGLMGSKEVRVPLVFVKGRLIGGADEVLRLDEEGKLGILLRGIPKAGPAACRGCAGIRFVMCAACDGSCKLLGEDGKKSVRCGKCNENGLIQCPICCC